MGSLAKRVAASVALTALLACSGLGLCWMQLVPRKQHHCCAPDPTSLTPAKPCSGAVALVALPTLAPPSALASPLLAQPIVAVQMRRPDPLAAAALPQRSPPLVLRI